MSLYNKILEIYPDLTYQDFMLPMGTIILQDNSDGQGPYIAKWEHSTYPKPTNEQLGI